MSILQYVYVSCESVVVTENLLLDNCARCFAMQARTWKTAVYPMNDELSCLQKS